MYAPKINGWKDKDKNLPGPCKTGAGEESYCIGRELGFFNCYGAGFAHFHTGVAAEAFFRVRGNSLVGLHFKNFNGANIHAFAAPSAFVSINRNIPRHSILQSVFGAVFSPLFLLQIDKNTLQPSSLLIAAAPRPVKPRMHICANR
jgi:hypothetical protein